MHRWFPSVLLVALLTAVVALSACGAQGAPAPSPATGSPPASSASPASPPSASSAAKPPASSASSPAASPSAKPAPSDDAAQRQLVEAAKKERQVVHYAGSGTKGTMEVIIPLFNKRYPEIEVRSMEGSSTASTARVLTEVASGQHVGDLISTGTTGMLGLKNQDLITALDWRPPNAQAVDPRLYTRATVGTPIYVNAQGLLVNLTMVKPGEITSWLDLLNPKWKGKLIWDNPASVGPGSKTFVSLYKLFGREYHEKLAALDPMIMDDERAAEAMIARGERAILMPGAQIATIFQEGSPMAFISPKEGVNYTPITAAIIKGAPHPNAAKLWIDFLVSEEVQTIMAREDLRVPSRRGAAQRPELRLDNMNFLEPMTPEEEASIAERWFPLAKEIYNIR